MRWAGQAACTREGIDAYRNLVWRAAENKQLGRHRHTWEDNIKMDLQMAGWWGMHWIDLAQDRDRRQAPMNTVMNLQVP
jgi:hypothetical protein